MSSSSLRYRAESWLTPSAVSFWRWRSDAETIDWVVRPSEFATYELKTIAFAVELASLIESLDDGELPPLDAILLFLLACREQPISAIRREALLRVASDANCLPTVVASLNRQFARISDANQSSPTTAKQLLTIARQNVRPARRTLAAGDAAEVVTILKNGRFAPAPSSRQDRRLVAAIQWFTEAAESLRLDAVPLREKIGLDGIPADLQPPSGDEESDEPSLRTLLDELAADPELGSLARVARDLGGIVTLPRPLLAVDSPDVGGVSDISNRGTIDKLLLSELAHDDDVLTTRVALGEALYFRRETPPVAPPVDRLLLLDIGIRTWGIPRLLIAATAIAVAALDEEQTHAVVHDAGELVDLDLRRRDGLLDLLGRLSPSDGLDEALADLANRELDPETELVVITTDETPTEELAVLAQRPSARSVIHGSVSREGRVELRQLTGGTRRLLRSIQLDLDRLLADPAVTTVSLIDHDADLPAVLQRAVFPLPVSVSLPASRSLSTYALTSEFRSLVTLTTDGRCLVTSPTQTASGSFELSASIPRGNVLLLDERLRRTTAEPVAVIVGETGYPALVRGDWIREDPTKPSRKLIGGGGRPLAAHLIENDFVALVRPHTIDVYDLSDASHNQSLAIPGSMRWRRGPYFVGPDGWYIIGRSERGVCFELMIPEKVATPDDVLSIEPVGIWHGSVPSNGRLTHTLVALLKGNRLFDIRADGPTKIDRSTSQRRDFVRMERRLSSFDRPRTYLLSVIGIDRDTDAAMVGCNREGIVTRPMPIASVAPSHLLPTRGMRRRFDAVRISGEVIELRTLDGRTIAIEQPANKERLHLVDRGRTAGSFTPFDRIETPGNGHYELGRADRLAATAWLDSRGFLHLRPRWKRSHEWSFVLTGSGVSLWRSDNTYAGSPALQPKGSRLQRMSELLGSLRSELVGQTPTP